MDSFQRENDRNNKKYNKRSEFIPAQKLIAIIGTTLLDLWIDSMSFSVAIISLFYCN